MYNHLQLFIRYLSFRKRAHNSRGHGMHSPFVFRFIKDVLNDRTQYEEYNRVEALRKQLYQDHAMVQVRELGAGSSGSKSDQRSISSIARHAAKPPKLAKLLFRIARYYRCNNILELGTSLGISSSYLALAGNASVLISMEGSPAIADRARQHFQRLGLNVRVVDGNFDESLPVLLTEGRTYDLVFIDGNHRKEPTLRYFSQLLPFIHNDSMVVFDDIHWSAEMEEVWEVIRMHEAVRCSIDLFFIGIVFFRKEFMEKQQFDIRF